jgi:hypothetical protein
LREVTVSLERNPDTNRAECECKQRRGRVWDRPLFSELASSLRRRQPRIVAHDFGIVWRIELVEAISSDSNLSLAEYDISRGIDFNHLIVETGGLTSQKSRLRPVPSCQKTVTLLSKLISGECHGSAEKWPPSA